MQKDALSLFNEKLSRSIKAMSDEELWEFLISNGERIKQIVDEKTHHVSITLHFYKQGLQEFERVFRNLTDEYSREETIYTLILDFCLEGEKIELDYYAVSGFLDDAASCDAVKAEDIMPDPDEEDEEFYWRVYFYVLEPPQIESMIRSLEKNFDKLDENAQANIGKIKKIKEKCLADGDYKAVFLYDM